MNSRVLSVPNKLTKTSVWVWNYRRKRADFWPKTNTPRLHYPMLLLWCDIDQTQYAFAQLKHQIPKISSKINRPMIIGVVIAHLRISNNSLEPNIEPSDSERKKSGKTLPNKPNRVCESECLMNWNRNNRINFWNILLPPLANGRFHGTNAVNRSQHDDLDIFLNVEQWGVIIWAVLNTLKWLKLISIDGEPKPLGWFLSPDFNQIYSDRHTHSSANLRSMPANWVIHTVWGEKRRKSSRYCNNSMEILELS